MMHHSSLPLASTASHAESIDEVETAPYSYVPALHSLHDAWPTFGWTRPPGQAAHVASPASYLPAPHTLHDVFPALGCTHPLGHPVHAPSRSTLYEPISQEKTHELFDMAGCNHPLGHVLHVSLPSSKLPAPQLLHDGWPALGCTHPPGHAVHFSSGDPGNANSTHSSCWSVPILTEVPSLVARCSPPVTVFQ
jgi:hypothetical protein